jgi:hypothetical protein
VITLLERGILFDNLKAAKKALDDIGVMFFLSHGSLLGFYRECGVIYHTSDLDLGIPYSAMQQYVFDQ